MSQHTLTPHPALLEQLFQTRQQSYRVFSELLGLHEIDYLSIGFVDEQRVLQVLSSMPSLEYNLFSSGLWPFDGCYDSDWIKKLTVSTWPSLYHPAHYDDLYSIKQETTRLPLGLSAAIAHEQGHYLISLASHKRCAKTTAIFTQNQDELVRIGLFCANRLKHLFLNQTSQHFISMEA